MLEEGELRDDELEIDEITCDVTEETPRNPPPADINVPPQPTRYTK